MPAARLTTPKLPPADSPAGRIVQAALHRLFSVGYSALTMDELAHELGMSKKTLYLHFPSKDALLGAVIDSLVVSLRAQLDAVLEAPDRSFIQKLCGVVDVVGGTMAKASPAMFRDLQRYAPAIYQRIEDIRQETIPYVFGRLIRAGIAEGKVRPDLDPAFATEFWLQAIRGLIQPAVLDRTQLTIRQTLEKAIGLFFGGLLTPAGRKDYENHLAACAKHSAP
ncbi:MAG: TetR/AcrR family transcriptional regulator [Opitutae bacterium]|nr:TetR/AcrR family transcriptional regulator [Opitutae bacterium]